jgi:Phosphotransferase enzyme family
LDEPLNGSRVERVGSTVRRPSAFWSPAVHDLLRHLETVGFPAPRLLDASDDVEILTWIHGESGPDGWGKVVPDSGLRQWAGLLRRYHDAVADYQPSQSSVWSSGTGTCSPGQVICHGDFGPWNSVWQADQVVGLIDWDHARPADRRFDVAYALEYVAPFRDDEECVRWLRYPEPPDRRHRIDVFCDAYGIAVPDDVVGQVAHQQRLVMHTCEALGRRGIEPQASWIKDGYLEKLQARIRWTESLTL